MTGFKAYVEEYVKDRVDSDGEPLKVAYECVNDRWEVAVAVSEDGFQQVSFVNSIATTKVDRFVFFYFIYDFRVDVTLITLPIKLLRN